MGREEFPTIDEAISWGVRRGYPNAVVCNIEGTKSVEIRAWLFEHSLHGTYYRWPARDHRGHIRHVWCFKSDATGFDFKMRFG